MQDFINKLVKGSAPPPLTDFSSKGIWFPVQYVFVGINHLLFFSIIPISKVHVSTKPFVIQLNHAELE